MKYLIHSQTSNNLFLSTDNEVSAFLKGNEVPTYQLSNEVLNIISKLRNELQLDNNQMDILTPKTNNLSKKAANIYNSVDLHLNLDKDRTKIPIKVEMLRY